MSRTKHSCPNCGDDVVLERWEAGYQYCKSKTCFEQVGRKAGVTMFEKVPHPDEIDLHPLELDDVDGAYQDND